MYFIARKTGTSRMAIVLSESLYLALLAITDTVLTLKLIL